MNSEFPEERSNAFWHKVYTAVIITTFIVVMLLWAFSRYFGP